MNASLQSLCYVIEGPTDMANSRTEEEWEWITAFRPHMEMIVDHTVVFSTILAVNGPGVVTEFDHIYYYRNWNGWVQDLASKPPLRNRREQAESIFVCWHNLEIFTVSIPRRLRLYILTPAWWMGIAKCAGIYPVPML